MKHTNSQLPTPNSHNRVAIVHDWLIGGGAELVVLQLHKMFPDAPIYTSCCTDEWRQKLDGKVVTGYLQRWPFPALRKFIPFLRGWWFSRLNLDGFDLVISSSGAEAKFIRLGTQDSRLKTKPLHVAYIHAPTHYYWSRYDQYMSKPGFPKGFNWLARLGLKVFVRPMRKWDYRAAQRPDYLLANSTHTQSAIKKYYGRDSRVIYPPVDTELFTKHASPAQERKGFIIVGRQTPYKRFDLAVAACTRLGLPLVVVGDGPEHQRLKKMAGPAINFTGRIKDHAEIARLVGSSQAFIFPGVDDFGIVSIEALAAGTPVIAYKDGGALDYIQPGKTGEFFETQNVSSLCDKLKLFSPQDYSPDDIKKRGEAYSAGHFRTNIEKFVKNTVK
jgi:glycosyltransferase involved in cell wall biosynthesis